MQIIQTKDQVFKVLEAGPWIGCEPIKVTKQDHAYHRWQGARIPLEAVEKIHAFFEWGYKEHRSEQMVHGFYSEEAQDWKFLVLPQKCVGMTVSLLEDHANRIPTFQRLGAGFECRLTWHHHCSGGAFASGTDLSDEKTKEGLHITTGGIGSKQYSFHARTSLWGEILPAIWSDWFEIPEAVRAVLPRKMWEQYLLYVFEQPHPDVEFPEWWKENVVENRYMGFQGTGYSGGSWSQPSSAAANAGASSATVCSAGVATGTNEGLKREFGGGLVLPDGQEVKTDKTCELDLRNKDWRERKEKTLSFGLFDWNFETAYKKQGWTSEEALDALEAIDQDEFMIDLMDNLHECNLTWPEAIEHVRFDSQKAEKEAAASASAAIDKDDDTWEYYT